MTRPALLLALAPLLLAGQDPVGTGSGRPQAETENVLPVVTSITVTGNIAAESPANVTVLGGAALSRRPGVNLDERLRDVPGFSLFRRSSSLVAHPTTQGVSLRGIGSSGASRTLVLRDGIPMNDPFGGWVYWTQFLPEEISRAEISRGASTSIFGDRAMSGAVSLMTRDPEAWNLRGGFQAGNRDTQEASLGFSHTFGRTAFSGAGRAFRTEGYYIVPESVRGPVDTPAGVRFVTGDAYLDHHAAAGTFRLRTNVLVEERRNGTVLTGNSTSLGTAAARYERELARDSVSITAFHTRERFHSSFSAVTAGRSVERLTFVQRVPSQGSGAAGIWRHRGSEWEALAGADAYRVSGTSTDRVFPSGVRIGGGSQLQHGVFVQGSGALGPARLFAGLRHSFTGQGSRFLSPSAGAAISAGGLRLRGSVYRAFRAPTLNELYREFRVGNTVTLANANLRPEKLWGAEAGADWIGENLAVRVTAFRNSLDRLITNTTLSVSPNAIVRQRANAAAAVSRGVETEVRREYRNWSGELAYLLVDSRYGTGPRVAQIPKHQGSAILTFDRGGTLVSAGFRTYAYQFDDDLNQFLLPGYGVIRLFARQRLAASLSAEAAVENLLDREFYSAFTPTPNVGAPRLWRIGLRWDGRLR